MEFGLKIAKKIEEKKLPERHYIFYMTCLIILSLNNFLILLLNNKLRSN